MAHMVETMAYAGAVPWHTLGNPVPAYLSPDEMIKEAGCDWEVEKLEIYAIHDKKRIKIPGKAALVRSTDGALLDVVGSEWHPLQNIDAFRFFNDFVKAGHMEMHTAGSLDGGRRVWALAKVNDSFELFNKKDVVEQYLLLSNPHKYGQCIDVRMTPIRVVCNNTLTFALDVASDKMVQVNHRREFDPDMVKETLGVAKEKLAVYKEAAQFLGKKKFKNETLSEYFMRVFPTNSDKKEVSRNAATALEILDTQPGAEYGRGTWWQAFNTVTYMTDHLLGRSVDTRMKSAWFGTNRKKKEDSLKLAIEYAEAA